MAKNFADFTLLEIISILLQLVLNTSRDRKTISASLHPLLQMMFYFLSDLLNFLHICPVHCATR